MCYLNTFPIVALVSVSLAIFHTAAVNSARLPAAACTALLMRFGRRQLGKLFVAGVAAVRSISCVDSQVRLQAVLPFKGRAAHRAAERSFLGVRSHVLR